MLLFAAASLVLMSWFKPLLFLAVFTGWAWVVSFLDKDLMNLHLQRSLWNLGQIAAGILAAVLMLFIPWFWWMGLPLGIILLVAPAVGYVMVRNAKVAEEHKWTFSTDIFTRRWEDAKVAQAQKHAEIKLMGPAGDTRPVPGPQDPAAPAHEALEAILDFSLPRAAESIAIAVGAQKATVMVIVDGVEFPQPDIDPRQGLLLVDYLKQNAALDVADRRRLQTGKARIKDSAGHQHLLGLSTSGSTRELAMTVQIDPDRYGKIKFDELGLLGPQRQQLEAALADPGRCVIVACPPKQGMTTALYSLVERHDPYTQSIVTLEDSVPFDLEGVGHNIIEPNTDGEVLAQRLAAMLRRDPAVVLLSKVTDSQIAQVIVGSSAEVRFYFGLFMEDSFQALRNWGKAIGDLQTASESLAAIVSCRMYRKLCLTCRVPYQPDPAMLKKMNLPSEKVSQLYRESGQVLVRDKPQPCPACHGLGYRGRSAVYEVLAMDGPARELMAANQFDQLRAHLRKQRMLYLQEAALAKVVEGVTSIKEVTRIFSKAQPAAAAAPAAPAAGKSA